MAEENKAEKETKENELISTHIFILPFYIKESEENKGNKKNEIDRKKERVLKILENWEEYDPDDNTRCYFTKYAKDALFREKNNSSAIEFHNKEIRENKFTFEILKNIKIENKENKENKECKEYKIDKHYILEIEAVKVKFFDTSVGTLSFVLNNREYKNFDDILDINNFGRMLYLGYEDKSKKYEHIIKKDGVEEVKIELKQKKKEKFENDIIYYFLKRYNKDNIDFVEDDRMYVISHFMDEELETNKIFPNSTYEEKWYNYIFVDESDNKMCQDIVLEKELVEKATYRRWLNYNTLYGICRYAFVLWTDNEYFSKNIINIHIKNLYFQLVSLVIAEKTSLVMLNEKMANVLNKIKELQLYEGKTTKEEIEKYKELEESYEEMYKKSYGEYLTYIAKLNFSEITHQEQGIELYNKCREQMNIEKLTEELDLKMKTLYEYSERRADKKAEEVDKREEKLLKGFGFIITTIEIFLGYLGIDSGYTREWGTFFKPADFILIKILIVFIILYCLYRKFIQNN